MPRPSSSLATLRPDLAASFEEFNLAMDRGGFVALRVLPVLEVALQSSPFGKIPLEQLLQNKETRRAPGSGYARAGWSFTTDSYACTEHGWEEAVDDREAQMYANYFDVEQVCADRALDMVLRQQERRVADLLFNATTWTGSDLTTAVTYEWDKPTTAVPITNVEAAAKLVWAGTGLWPNTLIINRGVFRNLRNCDQVIDRIASAGAGFPVRAQDITTQQLAAVFDLEKILVAGSAQNAAHEGQTRSLAEIWSDEYAMLCRTANSNDIREPCLGRTFHWGEDGSQIGGQVETYRDETVRGDVVRVRHDTDEKVLYAAMGHLLSNITT